LVCGIVLAMVNVQVEHYYHCMSCMAILLFADVVRLVKNVTSWSMPGLYTVLLSRAWISFICNKFHSNLRFDLNAASHSKRAIAFLPRMRDGAESAKVHG
jgi:hypothetical protein